MGVASGCGEQEVGVARGNGWNLWVLLLGGCICYFLQQHPYFLFISYLFQNFFEITFYVLNNF